MGAESVRLRRACLGARVIVLLSTGIAGCTGTRPMTLTECSDAGQQEVRLEASAVRLGGEFRRDTMSVSEVGTVMRRLVISVSPSGPQPGRRVIWTTLSVRPLGGAIGLPARLVTDYTARDISSTAASALKPLRNARREIVTVAAVPGEVVVRREALGTANLFGTILLDLPITPGGITVDEPVLKIASLWRADGTPIAPDGVEVILQPTAHPPGIDEVNALLELRYVVEDEARHSRERCDVAGRVSLIDRDSARPPLWDLGPSEPNQGRSSWLALFDRKSGAFRAIFPSPAAATSFANWGRATRATTVGPFRIGLFEVKPADERPVVPVDRDVAATFRPIESADWESMRVGPLGEP